MGRLGGFVTRSWSCARQNISTEMREAINHAWDKLKARKPDPKIFWDFIEAERNNVLKVYEFGPRIRTTLRTGTTWVNLTTGESGSTAGDPTTFDYFMRSGVFESKDPRQLCHEAIEFWSKYLDAIDKEITNKPP